MSFTHTKSLIISTIFCKKFFILPVVFLKYRLYVVKLIYRFLSVKVKKTARVTDMYYYT